MPEDTNGQPSSMKDTLKKRASGAIKNKVEDKVAEMAIEKGKALGGNIKSRVMGGGQKEEGNINNNGGIASTEGENLKKPGSVGVGGAGRPSIDSGIAKEENPESIGGKTTGGIAPEGPSKPILSEEDYKRKQEADLRFAKNPESIGAIKEKVGERAQNRKQFSQSGGAQRMGSIPNDPEAKAQKRAEIMANVQRASENKIRDAKSRGAGEIGGEINKQAKRRIKDAGRDLDVKSRIAVNIGAKVAGRRLANVLAAIAEKMAKEAERGGPIGFVMILMTYLMAGIKDILDAVAFAIPGISLALGIMFGIIISLFWLLICGSNHGAIVRWFVKKALTRILVAIVIDGLFGIVPTFLVMNVWTHWGYNKKIKKAEKDLEEVGRHCKAVVKAVNSA